MRHSAVRKYTRGLRPLKLWRLGMAKWRTSTRNESDTYIPGDFSKLYQVGVELTETRATISTQSLLLKCSFVKYIEAANNKIARKAKRLPKARNMELHRAFILR